MPQGTLFAHSIVPENRPAASNSPVSLRRGASRSKSPAPALRIAQGSSQAAPRSGSPTPRARSPVPIAERHAWRGGRTVQRYTPRAADLAVAEGPGVCDLEAGSASTWFTLRCPVERALADRHAAVEDGAGLVVSFV